MSECKHGVDEKEDGHCHECWMEKMSSKYEIQKRDERRAQFAMHFCSSMIIAASNRDSAIKWFPDPSATPRKQIVDASLAFADELLDALGGGSSDE